MKRLFWSTLLVIGLCAMASAQARPQEKEVSFKTDDDWTISGMLGLPSGSTAKVPAVIFLHTYAHDRDAYGQYLYPGLAQIIGGRGAATLRIDLRGRGKSEGAKELHSFSAEERAKLYLDVQAAIRFLAAQDAVDSARIAIVAEEASAEAAVKGWAGDRRVRAMALISGRLDEAAKKQIAADADLPLLLVVSKEDREGLRDMADAYKLNRSDQSRISVYNNIGIGTTMFSVWRSEHPKEKPIEDDIAEWIIQQLNSAGQSREVSFKTEDGWELRGTLRMPSAITENTPVPGVVLLHSSFTDRHIFDHLADLMVKRGLAVLNFDTRGRGKSINKGEFLQLPVEERDRGYLDAKAALSFLTSQSGINRVGLLGTDRGATYALAAADSRVGALVLMTTLLNTKEKEEITKLDIPIFYIASKDIEIAARSMTEAYAATRNRGSRLMVFNGGALGYQIFNLDETLEPTLAQWMKEQLSR